MRPCGCGFFLVNFRRANCKSSSCSHSFSFSCLLIYVSFISFSKGKSTLLRILAENCALDSQVDTSNQGMKYTGTITSPRDVRIAYVEQEPPMPEGITVGDALLGITGDRDTSSNTSNKQQQSIYATVRRYKLAVATAETDPEKFAKASSEMDAVSGWSVLTLAEEIADKLRVRHLQDQPLSKLSGGERKRVALAAALVQEPDVLLLDEPTNFLSLAGVQWLADLLTRDRKLTILMVTHDRAFLDDVCNSILELDHGKVYEYQGSYQDYLQGKDDRLALLDAEYQSSKAKYRLELDWMRRQPQARATKAKARIEAFYKLQKSTKPRPADASLQLESDGSRRIGGKVISMRHVNLKFGDRYILKDFSYDFCKGDRICLSGANGVGKTTFVNVLTGQQAADSGEIEVGDTIVLGVYEQLGIKLEDPTQTVLEFVVDRVQSLADADSMDESAADAGRLLKRFEFPRERWNERVSILSGGERRRLQMLSVFSQKPNFLIMDEPSVDCDLDTLTALEGYLQEYDGVLIIVSHDRAFADKVTDHLFVFEGGGEIKDFTGSLSEYAATMVEMENENIAPGGSSPAGKEGEDSADKKSNFKEDKVKRNEDRNILKRAKKDMENLDKAMEKLKAKATKVQKDIEGTSSDEGWSVLAALTEDLGKLNEEIEEKELRWMELAEILEEAEVEA
jgi:ATP-binding cassette subfamily F protein uup